MKLIIFALFIISSLFAQQIFVIVNKNVKVKTLGRDELVKIYLGKIHQLASNQTIQPIERRGNIKERFHALTTGKSVAQLSKHWAKLVFTGKGAKPEEFSSDEEVISWIKNNPSYIGYVESEKLSEGVKIIFTLSK